MIKKTNVVVNIAGDSGDGIQLVGSEFSVNTALKGNELATFPNFPAEIRAPQGTLHGVSGFQIHFASEHVFTPGDSCDVLVVMNAAALKSQLHTLKKEGLLIANISGFSANNLRLAKYATNPLEDGSLADVKLIQVDVSKLTKEALADSPISSKEKERAKNMAVLGILYWMYMRDMKTSIDYVQKKFGKDEDVASANIKALHAGYNFAETSELFQSSRVEVKKSTLAAGHYRSITGNHALAVGLVVASQLADLALFYGSYPITPASDILHELSQHKSYGVVTFQAEDEISAIMSALGASYGGSLGVTGTSGPGMSLKSEAMGLAIMLELPLLICNIQRGGPSTGLPTKTEQSDLLQAFYGRHGESPLAILAAQSPADCFYIAIEAARIALEHMTPVIVLSDGYIANGSEIWRFPAFEELTRIHPPFKKSLADGETVLPYQRDEDGVRPWIVPGTPQLTHRIGGLEKEDGSGNISYDPRNHERMVKLRAGKIDRIADFIPEQKIESGKDSGKILVVGWGSTFGVISTVVRQLSAEGISVSHTHLRFIHPFPKNLKALFGQFEKILVPEINNQQLYKILRSQFDGQFYPLNKIQGVPFSEEEIASRIKELALS